MKTIVEKRFEYKGYPCVVLFHSSCWRCGYVGIPTSDFRKSMLLEIECHGGITYAEDYLYGQEDKDTIWIGFDCAHYRDGFDYEAGSRYFQDDLEVLKSIEDWKKIHSEYPFDDSFPARSIEFVESECRHIVDQLIAETIE